MLQLYLQIFNTQNLGLGFVLNTFFQLEFANLSLDILEKE